MSTPATLLRLMWLASPALPVGGFSYSAGLEAAVEAGHVQGETAVGDWLLDQLQLSLARADRPACAQAFRAWQTAHDPLRLQALNDWVLATRETAEFRLQTEQMGRSLVEWLRNGEQAQDPRITHCAALLPSPSWPMVFALACVLAVDADRPAQREHTYKVEGPRQALLALAFGWAENMAQAAMKSVPLGQAAAQRILTRLTQAIPQAVESALALPDTERQAFTPMLAILSSRHESQYSRLFRS
jgi:urease accessory protein